MNRSTFICLVILLQGSALNAVNDITQTNTVSGLNTHQGAYSRWNKARAQRGKQVAAHDGTDVPYLSSEGASSPRATNSINAMAVRAANSTERPHPGGMRPTGLGGEALYERAKQLAANRGTTTDEILRASQIKNVES